MKCFHHPVVYLVIVTLFALIFLAVDQIPSDAEKHTVLDKILSQTQISLEQQGGYICRIVPTLRIWNDVNRRVPRRPLS